MKIVIKNTGIKVKAFVKAGGFGGNHNRCGLKVQTSVRGGYKLMNNNHSRRLAAVR